MDASGAPVPACKHEPREITSSRALALMPAELEAEIGDEEIVTIGDGWVKVTKHIGAAVAGNEILDLHYRARRRLGETRPQPESFDGIPCRACDEMALEQAEPPVRPGHPREPLQVRPVQGRDGPRRVRQVGRHVRLMGAGRGHPGVPPLLARRPRRMLLARLLLRRRAASPPPRRSVTECLTEPVTPP